MVRNVDCKAFLRCSLSPLYFVVSSGKYIALSIRLQYVLVYVISEEVVGKPGSVCR